MDGNLPFKSSLRNNLRFSNFKSRHDDLVDQITVFKRQPVLNYSGDLKPFFQGACDRCPELKLMSLSDPSLEGLGNVDVLSLSNWTLSSNEKDEKNLGLIKDWMQNSLLRMTGILPRQLVIHPGQFELYGRMIRSAGLSGGLSPSFVLIWPAVPAHENTDKLSTQLLEGLFDIGIALRAAGILQPIVKMKYEMFRAIPLVHRYLLHWLGITFDFRVTNSSLLTPAMLHSGDQADRSRPTLVIVPMNFTLREALKSVLTQNEKNVLLCPVSITRDGKLRHRVDLSRPIQLDTFISTFDYRKDVTFVDTLFEHLIHCSYRMQRPSASQCLGFLSHSSYPQSSDHDLSSRLNHLRNVLSQRKVECLFPYNINVSGFPELVQDFSYESCMPVFLPFLPESIVATVVLSQLAFPLQLNSFSDRSRLNRECVLAKSEILCRLLGLQVVCGGGCDPLTSVLSTGLDLLIDADSIVTNTTLLREHSGNHYSDQMANKISKAVANDLDFSEDEEEYSRSLLRIPDLMVNVKDRGHHKTQDPCVLLLSLADLVRPHVLLLHFTVLQVQEMNLSNCPGGLPVEIFLQDLQKALQQQIAYCSEHTLIEESLLRRCDQTTIVACLWRVLETLLSLGVLNNLEVDGTAWISLQEDEEARKRSLRRINQLTTKFMI